MSEDHPEDFPKTQPAFAHIPPWPPKETTRDAEDDGRPYSIHVSFVESYERHGKTESSLPIADFVFKSGHRKHEHETVTIRDLAPLFISALLLPDHGGMLSIGVSQSGQELLSVHCRSPYRTFANFRLSSDTTIMISIFRKLMA